MKPSHTFIMDVCPKYSDTQAFVPIISIAELVCEEHFVNAGAILVGHFYFSASVRVVTSDGIIPVLAFT